MPEWSQSQFSLPDFLGIGAQKSATTWIYLNLKRHPEIRVSRDKEIGFFDTDERYARGLEWYEDQFPTVEGDKRTGEFSPTYLTSEAASKRIARDLGSVDLIVSLRDPISRFGSQVKHFVRHGALETTSVEEAVEQFPALLEKSKYHKHLADYFGSFEKSRFKIVFFEEIADRPEEVMSEIYAFLGVEEKELADIKEEKVGRGYVPRSRVLEKIKKGVSLALNRFELGREVMNNLRGTALTKAYKEFNSRTVEFDPTERELEFLRNELRAEYEDLEELIGRPTPWTMP